MCIEWSLAEMISWSRADGRTNKRLGVKLHYFQCLSDCHHHLSVTIIALTHISSTWLSPHHTKPLVHHCSLILFMPIIIQHHHQIIKMHFPELQAPRFITLPSASGSVVAEGRTKILQCQALGESSTVSVCLFEQYFSKILFSWSSW